MKKKVYYKLNRYQVTKVEVETAEQEQAVKMLNRDTDRFAKSEDTYRERYASLDEMYEESGFEPADDSPTPEEQFLENEKNEAIKRLVAKAMEELTEKQKIVVYKTFWEQKTLREISRELNAHHSSIEEIYSAAMKKLKKFWQISKNTPPKHPVTFQ